MKSNNVVIDKLIKVFTNTEENLENRMGGVQLSEIFLN